MNATVAAKRLDMTHNVSIRILDEATGEIVREHEGHNAATNSMLTGIGHYLIGDGVLSQGDILSRWVPQYMSVGTMGLQNQEEDDDGLPANLGLVIGDEATRFADYLKHAPGFGADGYDPATNNDRAYMGLGPDFANRPDPNHTVSCELVSEAFPRSTITYRDIIPEVESEYPKTIDIVLSTFISTGALAAFRESDKDYVFITEVGLWSKPTWEQSGSNGLLAGYRIAPPSSENWDMSVAANRRILKENIIKVGRNQVVQIIWKIQLGGIEQLGGVKQFLSDVYDIEWQLYPDLVKEYSWQYQIWPYDKYAEPKSLLKYEIWDGQNH